LWKVVGRSNCAIGDAERADKMALAAMFLLVSRALKPAWAMHSVLPAALLVRPAEIAIQFLQ
jgi:hypothetical protein